MNAERGARNRAAHPHAVLCARSGGEGGIRTHEEVAPLRDFQSRALGHYATSPGTRNAELDVICPLFRVPHRSGGEGGIRTHEAHRLPLFESGTINHSDTSPPIIVAYAAPDAARSSPGPRRMGHGLIQNRSRHPVGTEPRLDGAQEPLGAAAVVGAGAGLGQPRAAAAHGRGGVGDGVIVAVLGAGALQPRLLVSAVHA